MYFLQKQTKADPDFIANHLPDICASIQKTIVNTLLKKFKLAAQELGVTHLAIAGGVSANSELRREFAELGKRMNWQTYIPKFEYCTDNAGMIAMSAWFQYLDGDFAPQTVVPRARFPISEG